jgi:predicted pyridoxine 5'-phosphate oxidase superfamily flavin-nucleotide-binding protein
MAGPFHPGEIEVQRRAGVRAAAERVGRIIAPGLPADAGRRLLARHRFAVAASVDVEGWPRATPLTGSEGFLEPVADDLVRIAAPLHSGAPLAGDLGGRPELGLLAFDPIRRQRLRLNGRAHLAPEGLFLLVDQAYGNCAKYIQKRRLVAEETSGAAGPPRSGRELSLRQRASIERADTFFLASFHPAAGADASHRGGLPGFVRVAAADRLSFADYPGNAMFNTLGNLVAYPRLALLFVDFATGDLLEIAGEARVDAELEVEVRVAAVRESRGAMPLRYELVEYSPVLPRPSRIPAAGISRRAGTPNRSGDPK